MKRFLFKRKYKTVTEVIKTLDADIIKKAMKYKYDMTENCYAPYRFLLEHERTDLIEIIIEPLRPRTYAIEWFFNKACMHGKMKVLKFTMQYGVDYHNHKDLGYNLAISYSRVDVVCFLLTLDKDFKKRSIYSSDE